MTPQQCTIIGIDGESSANDAAVRAQGIDSAVRDAVACVLGAVEVDAALLDGMPVGPALAALLASLDAGLMAPDTQLAFAAATERLAAWVQSLQNTSLLAYAGTSPRLTRYDVDGRAEELVDVRRSHLARRMLWSEPMAHQRLTVARTLHASLPQCAAALAQGRVSGLRAAALAESASALTSRIDAVLEATTNGPDRDALVAARATLLLAFESKTVPYATGHDLSRTRARARAVVASLDPEGLAWRRARAARDLTTVTLRHDEDCLSTLQATMPSELAIECLRAIDGVADDRARIDQGLPAGVRRAHAMHGLLTGTIANGWSTEASRDDTQGRDRRTDDAPSASNGDESRGRRGRRSAHLNVTIELATLLALRSGAAHIEGAGPIPADVARSLTEGSGASIRWLITDDTGAVIDISPRRYRISRGLRDLIAARDSTCVEPHCSVPTERCEIDHVIPFNRGGASTPDNLQPRCKRHHQLKTHGEALPETGAAATSAPLPRLAPTPEPDTVDAARDTVNECHRAYLRALEYGAGAHGAAAALAAARVARFAATAVERTGAAQRLLAEGPLAATLSLAMTLYHQRPQTPPARGTKPAPAAAIDDDPPPF